MGRLIQEKPSAILVEVLKLNQRMSKEEPYAQNISNRVDTTYSHAVKTLDKLEAERLVTREEKSGRKRMVRLTDKGEEVAKQLQEIRSTLSQEATA